MTQPCPRPLERFVYVIGPEQGLQKVGIATDPHARLATLRTASPFELVVHAAIPVPFRAAHAVEQRAHKLLAAHRVVDLELAECVLTGEKPKRGLVFDCSRVTKWLR